MYYEDIGIFLPPNTDFHNVVNTHASKLQDSLTYFQTLVNHDIFKTFSFEVQEQIEIYILNLQNELSRFNNLTDNYQKYQETFLNNYSVEPIARIELGS